MSFFIPIYCLVFVLFLSWFLNTSLGYWNPCIVLGFYQSLLTIIKKIVKTKMEEEREEVGEKREERRKKKKIILILYASVRALQINWLRAR